MYRFIFVVLYTSCMHTVAGMNYIPACELACERVVPNQKVQRSPYYIYIDSTMSCMYYYEKI